MPSRIIAVDFDGTLCTNDFPRIGKPNMELIERLRDMRENGDKLILYTMRENILLQNALNACKEWGLEFDGANDNLDEIVEAFQANPRKVFANIYIDDHNAKDDDVFTNLPYEAK